MSNGRNARVFVGDRFAGILTEGSETGYRFRYDSSYSDVEHPVSMTLPVQDSSYESRILFPFFDGLIPEGWLLNISIKNWKLDPQDRMGLLLAACAETIGYVSIRPEEWDPSSLSEELNHSLSGVKPAASLPAHMRGRCLGCLGPLADDEDGYHVRCSIRLFGSRKPPLIVFSGEQIMELARENVLRRTTIPGVQKKISVSTAHSGGSGRRARFTITGLWGSHILKPPSDEYEQLPENEHLTLLLAGAAGLRTEAFGLLTLTGGEPVFIARRFDREKHKKFACEDFGQLTGRLAVEKYNGSLEQAAQAIRRFSAAPGDDLLRFFELNLFCFLTGNSDMHLKNFSLLRSPTRGKTMRTLLAPAYDLLNTSIVLEEDREETALTLNGKKSKLRGKDFFAFARSIGLQEKVTKTVFERIVASATGWNSIIAESFLSDSMKEKYAATVASRLNRLG